MKSRLLANVCATLFSLHLRYYKNPTFCQHQLLLNITNLRS